MNAFKYLAYFRAFCNLFDLEYFFNKLPSRAHSLANMEDEVMAGRNFWDENDDTFTDDPYVDNDTNEPQYSQTDEDTTNPERNALAERVAQRLALEKKYKNQLINDLDSIKDNFMLWEKRMRAQDLHLDLHGATNFLTELVNINFYNLMHTLGTMRETYCRQGIA